MSCDGLALVLICVTFALVGCWLLELYEQRQRRRKARAALMQRIERWNQFERRMRRP